MAYDEKLANRIRGALSHLPAVEEKKMFGGLAFMVDNKMCIKAGADRIMSPLDLYSDISYKYHYYYYYFLFGYFLCVLNAML